MNIVLWIFQFLLGIYFFFTGIVHFIVPPGLPAPMAWMYELPPGLHYFSGIAEILAGVGLILPGLTRIQPRLTTFAALGLVLLMLGATVWHLPRGEFQNIVMNLILAGIAGFIAFGRSKLSPLKAK
ncbi:MAG: DoxX family protein [Chloroflexi bacterium]|nr:DoxX family protein [Chloroflexota bacterium]